MNAFSGFDPQALSLLKKLPTFDEQRFADARPLLASGVREPGAALIEEVARTLDPTLTVSRRSSVSPLHRDLRFAKPGAPRYKDHLLLTAWTGKDKKTAPTLWIRVDAESVGFASGIAFTPALRARWRVAVASDSGDVLSQHVAALTKSHAAHHLDVAGRELKSVPRPWTSDHPRADLLRHTSFQVRFREPLPRLASQANFAAWCVERLKELLPVHDWLVSELGDSAP